MGKKRKSGGRSKGKKGRGGHVQCDFCGKMVPRDKAKKVTRYVSLVDYRIAKEIRAKGAVIPRERVTKTACVSCAVHRGLVKVRSKDDRKSSKSY